jgi:hypothetical protein
MLSFCIKTDLSQELIKNTFMRNILAHQIGEELKQTLKKHCSDKEVSDLVLKSPAFFGINSAFTLCEFIKNTLDAEGCELYIYVSVNEDQTVSCAVIDNGKGFSDLFLNRTNDEKVLLNYFSSKLASTEDNIKRIRISSPKFINLNTRGNTQGGQGLGLATIARILETGNGKVEIANVRDLSEKISKTFNMHRNTHPRGAVILLSSVMYSLELHKLYQSTQRKMLEVEDINSQYLNYLMLLNLPVLKISSPTLSPRSPALDSDLISPLQPNKLKLNSPLSSPIRSTAKTASMLKLVLNINSEVEYGADEIEIKEITPISSKKISAQLPAEPAADLSLTPRASAKKPF